MEIVHHGAVAGVTGSCHELRVHRDSSVLVDCGLFQGDEQSGGGASAERLEIDFPLVPVQALLLTHCHLDHVGRIPYLLAAGFGGPIYCSEPTAALLPLVLEDAIEIGFTRDRRLVERFLELVRERTVALPYHRWTEVPLAAGSPALAIRLQPAGHILGSAYIECRIRGAGGERRVVFSGDLGPPHTPLLPAPRPPWSADLVVLESTYGDRLHEGRRTRRRLLQQVLQHCLQDRGVVLVPAFSIGRTQELLYELEQIVHLAGEQEASPGLRWDELEIVVDSPLASRFTRAYASLQQHWDAEAKRRVAAGRNPLAFDQVTTIGDHQAHLRTVEYLRRSGRPTVVIAGSGMCAGGRIVHYLQALLGDPRTDVLFVGYQAAGTPGRAIQQYGPRHGYVELEGRRYDIRAGVHTLPGYSAHADQHDLVRFVRRMRHPPAEVRLVHGDPVAKATLQAALTDAVPGLRVTIGEPAARG